MLRSKDKHAPFVIINKKTITINKEITKKT